MNITLTSGSIFNGNPITFAVTPTSVVNASMHRIILEVECGISGGNYEVIKMSAPIIAEGKAQTIDISSALRTFRDSYEYTPDATSYPLVKFNVKAYDEYMTDGDIHQTEPIFYPSAEDHLCSIFGAFSDFDRLTSGVTKGVQQFTRKPTTLPQLCAVGETLAYTPAYTEAQMLEQSLSLTPPQSKIATITKEGIQTLGYQQIFALPAEEAKDRQVFRFINSFGVLESVSIPRATTKSRRIDSEQNVIARQETFNMFSRFATRKFNNRETWKFITDPLDEAWLLWYIHEFLMSEHVWIQSPSSATTWLRVHIVPEEETTFLDESKDEQHVISFSAQFDITGSPKSF